jgi:hypothetical protein
MLICLVLNELAARAVIGKIGFLIALLFWEWRK